jgi:hypothetical protein
VFNVTVTRTSTTSCRWSSASDSSWIGIQGDGTAASSGAINYVVAANTGPTRTGRITFSWDGGSTQHIVTQSGAQPPPNTAFAVTGTVSDGTSGGRLPNVRVAIFGGADDGRTTTTDASGNYAFSGVAAGSRTFTASASGYVDGSRTVDLSADTRIDFVLTRAVACASLTTTTQAVPASGGSFSGGVVATTNTCAWTAASDSSWLTVTPASGTGNGTLSYSAAANTGAARTGRITLTSTGGAVQLLVNQSAPDVCTFSVSPSSLNFQAIGGGNTITVTASAPTCAWTAQSLAGYILVTGGASGTGSGTVSISIQSNGGAGSRGDSVVVAGQTIRVTQDAPLPSLGNPAGGCSSGGTALQEDTTLQFINTTSQPITATDGGQTISVAPNSGINQQTKVGKIWAVFKPGNVCVGNYTAMSGGRSAIVQ